MTKGLKGFFRPGQANPEVTSRKELFAGLNEFVTERSGWLISVPGEREVTLETLEGSTLPDAIRKLGYTVTELGEGQRILPHAIVERFTTRADGTIGETRTHVGIVKTRRFSFDLP